MNEPRPAVVQRRSVWRQLAEQLQAKITAGAYAVGSLLPSEDVLGREFAVSRQTVRRAVAELRYLRLVETEQGRGTIVVRSTPLPDPSTAQAGEWTEVAGPEGEHSCRTPDRADVMRAAAYPGSTWTCYACGGSWDLESITRDAVSWVPRISPVQRAKEMPDG